METQGIRVNMKKTKVMCHGRDMDVLKDTAWFPSGVCRHGRGTTAQIAHTGYPRLAVGQGKNLQRTPHTGEVGVEALGI